MTNVRFFFIVLISSFLVSRYFIKRYRERQSHWRWRKRREREMLKVIAAERRK